MINETVLRRILFVGTGLVFVVSLILAFIVIPSVSMDTSPQATTERAVHGIWVVIIVHMLIVITFAGTIFVNQRGFRINKGLLVVVGVVLLLLSLIVLDGASSYINHPDPGMHRIAILMFICVGCNVLASVLSFFTAWHSRQLYLPSK
jgi:hypothetical protein